MIEKEYPTLKDVKQMNIPHGKLIAADRHSSSHGMMALSGVSDTFTLKEVNGEYVLLHSHKTDMDGTTEKLYRADAQALQKIAEIAERENLYAWGEMQIDPEKDSRPKIYDFSSSSGITLYTDDSIQNRFSFNCDTARYYGAGDVIDEINKIFSSYITDENFISEKQIPITDPNILEMKKNYFKMPIGVDPSKQTPLSANLGAWKCPECNAEGNTGKFCTECGTLRPAPVTEKTEPETKPEPEPEQEWTYSGGAWTCPLCNGEGNEGKFCATCGSWRPDLDPNKDKRPKADLTPQVQPGHPMFKGYPGAMGISGQKPDEQPEKQEQPAFPMENALVKAMGLLPGDKQDEQLAALLAKPAQHGRLTKFEHHCWSNGMTPNSHHEDTTTAEWTESGEVTVRWYMQQGTADAMVTDYKAGEKVIAELEKFITESNLTNLGQLKYDRSKDPFSGMTDTSGDSYYTMIFDDSSVGGNKSAYFKLDPAAISQHGGGAIAEKLRDFMQRLCTESEMLSSHLEPPKTPAMSGFMGMGMLMQHSEAEKWTCPACGHDCSGGKFCNNCGEPRNK